MTTQPTTRFPTRKRCECSAGALENLETKNSSSIYSPWLLAVPTFPADSCIWYTLEEGTRPAISHPPLRLYPILISPPSPPQPPLDARIKIFRLPTPPAGAVPPYTPSCQSPLLISTTSTAPPRLASMIDYRLSPAYILVNVSVAQKLSRPCRRRFFSTSTSFLAR